LFNKNLFIIEKSRISDSCTTFCGFMDKRQSVIESIQKLLALNVSDNEIADNLFDVGISKEEANGLIIEAKGIKQNISANPNPPLSVSPSSPQPQLGSKIQIGGAKSQKNVFDDTATKLSMNDQVISQIPFVKQAPEKNISKMDVSKEDVENNIIGDVAKQSNPSEVGEELKEEMGDELGESVNDAQQEESDSKKLSPAASINDEENEDEFEDRVKKVLDSAKKNPSVSQPVQSVSPQVSKVQPVLSNDFSSPKSPVPNYQPSSSQKISPQMSFDSSVDFEELWKKGIVVAVNAKLAEMKQLKEDVESQVSQKVDEAVRKEMYQSKVLLDSQKELLISSNKEALDAKQKEITFIIDSKIAELKQYNRQISDNLKAMEEIKKQQEASIAQIKTVLEDAKKTKSQLLIEVNSEMIKTKSQAQAFLDSSAAQLNQMDERVNKTLELEKNIAEGMLTQAEQKIEQLAIKRADDLIDKMEVELNKLEATNKKISPEILDDKIKTIEKFRTEFISNMQISLGQINAAIEELNKKNELAQSTLEEKTLAIDAKMEELTKFEKQFTQMMDHILGRT
jgi:hypothetical protein